MRYGEDYIIAQKGDTPESIAERYLGDASLAPLIRQINTIAEMGIYTGQKILLHPYGLEKEKTQKYCKNKGGK